VLREQRTRVGFPLRISPAANHTAYATARRKRHPLEAIREVCARATCAIASASVTVGCFVGAQGSLEFVDRRRGRRRCRNPLFAGSKCNLFAVEPRRIHQHLLKHSTIKAHLEQEGTEAPATQ
jgi:hypothetical protein